MLLNDNKQYNIPLMLYWISFAGLCSIFVAVARIVFNKCRINSDAGKTMMWFLNVAAIITLTLTTVRAIAQIGLFNDIDIKNKATVTVLWSLCAFVQMWIGMRFKNKTMRIISLLLLALVLSKLFMYDISNASQGAKIIAFVVLGVVLLVLSFLYQKLKKILFEDDNDDNDDN
jgi:uncharacterized membrane protein